MKLPWYYARIPLSWMEVLGAVWAVGHLLDERYDLAIFQLILAGVLIWIREEDEKEWLAEKDKTQ